MKLETKKVESINSVACLHRGRAGVLSLKKKKKEMPRVLCAILSPLSRCFFQQETTGSIFRQVVCLTQGR